MSEQLIKDRHGRVIGRLISHGDGTIDLYDGNGRMAGHQDKEGRTTDRDGRLAGQHAIATLVSEE